ncbi:MAG: 4Fe-4S binding protein [Bacillota bacterium]
MVQSVSVLGFSATTPFGVSAGPLTRDGESVRRWGETPGVGFVVTKTIYSRDANTPKPTMAKVPGGLINYDWSGTGIDTWLTEYWPSVQACRVPVILSIASRDTQELVDMAASAEDRGAKALEVPIPGTFTPREAGLRMERLAAAVRIPVIPKIGSSLPDTAAFARALVDGGASAISAVNTIGPGVCLDVSTNTMRLGNARGYGYLSGAVLKPLALRTVLEIAAAVRVPIIGGGGVSTGRDALEFIMAGADLVFVHTAAILNGPSVFKKINDECFSLLSQMGMTLCEAKGCAAREFAQKPGYETVVPRTDPALCTGCGICVRSCIYDALSLDCNRVSLDAGRCFGCGLCVTLCPKGALARG